MKLQIHLSEKYCSGLGVRVVPLSPDQSNQAMLDAAKVIGVDGNMLELKKLQWSYGVKRMITEVTTAPSKDLLAPEVTWRKVTPADLDANYASWFGAKDDAILQAFYRDLHEVSEEEVKLVVGKALPVSEG